jgi:hypothetical protein
VGVDVTHAERHQLWAAPPSVGSNLEVSPIGDPQMRRGDKAGDAAVAQEKHVIDDLLGRRDISIAVVPRKLYEFQKVEGPGGLLLAEHGSDALLSFSSPIRAAHRHQGHLGIGDGADRQG